MLYDLSLWHVQITIGTLEHDDRSDGKFSVLPFTVLKIPDAFQPFKMILIFFEADILL